MSAISRAQFERSSGTAYTTDLDNLANETGSGRRPGFGQLRHGGHDKPSRPFFSRPPNVNGRKANPRRKVIFGVIGMESRALSELMSEGPLRFPNYWNAWKVRAQKSLTSTLRRLERDGLVRSIPAQVPIRVDYEAPALGHELIVKFQPLKVGRSQLHDGL
jgi:hypothetical protein